MVRILLANRLDCRRYAEQAPHEWWIDRSPLPDGGFGVVCYFRDISAQVKAREDLRRANRVKFASPRGSSTAAG
ncbi:MAG TPA: hypothetical protein VKT49_26675 [Bryobacteraceae bacterium]|nr:hypothetical protein [Bryobacteraceae bacterium]